MKILCFSDLHGDVAAASRLATLAAGVDLLIGAGDFGNMRRQVGDCIPALRQSNRPAVVVPGNNETQADLQAACRDWIDAWILHGESATVLGLNVFGLGGGVPETPFGSWSHDLSEMQAELMLAGCPRRGVLVCHSPPRGVVDVSSRGESLGSRAIRAAIERVEPQLVVCGHIHGSRGQVGWIGPTAVVNAGPEGVIWEL